MKTRWTISKKLVAFVVFLALILFAPIAGYATEGEGLEKLTGAAETVKDNLLDMAQAFSMPLLMISFVGGAVLLVSGILISIFSQRLGDIIRGSGMIIMFGGVIAFVLMNIAPNIGDTITSFLGGIFE
ncbi:hypothetical protein [Desulfofalx alkaliphila]|uniref:hypothetical protein n=1 Tax=Desulfofalx alkaliphila TaxID=105483 RepID=UPI0004E2527D|nr:hypothetical protein [Desulfofalx alkaliphila]